MSTLLTLPELAKALGLPETWLRAEADAGQLPVLTVKGSRGLIHYRFDLTAVETALADRARRRQTEGGGL